jgi:hypothetical protein
LDLAALFAHAKQRCLDEFSVRQIEPNNEQIDLGKILTIGRGEHIATNLIGLITTSARMAPILIDKAS